MDRPTRKDRTNTLPLLILIAGFVILFYYGVTSLSARDPLWFSSEFEGQPSRIIVYGGGQRAHV